MIREAIGMIVSGETLTQEQAAEAMNEIMEETATPAQFGAFVTALRIRGETIDEIAGMAQVMREKALRVEFDGPMVDTCGTGGDGLGTFNISTTSAFVIAASGVKVAKHGNRAMSGACGSADVLESLGVKIDLGPEGVKRCLEQVGMGFMFAQSFHPAMRFAGPLRREIGIRTVFNILGPLSNPAGAQAQVLGVADVTIAEKMAQVLKRLGSSHAFVVHGTEGIDEVSICGGTQVWELRGQDVRPFFITPEDMGLQTSPLDALSGGSVDINASILRSVLGGEEGSRREAVLANAAFALVAADRVPDFRAGVNLAQEMINTGAALNTLESLIRISNMVEI